MEATTAATPILPAKPRLAVLDPGHHAFHNRGVAAGYWEGNVMLIYALILARELRKLGWLVTLTRYTPLDLSLARRGRMAAAKKAALFYSLHSNACGDQRVRRVTAFYSVNRPGDRAIAQAQADTVARVMGSPSAHAEVRRGVADKKGDYYTVIDAASDGGVSHVLLLEHDFHTNPVVCKWLMNKDNLKRMAVAEAACLNANIR